MLMSEELALLGDLVKGGVKYALGSIRRYYEKNEKEEDNLPFHVCQHTIDVIIRSIKLAGAMKLPKKEVLLVKLAAAFHDVIMQWDVRIPLYDVKIPRNANNEFNSA